MIENIGQQIEQYQVLRLLGSGKLADVYLGEHRFLHTQVALKILRMQLTAHVAEEFLAEVQRVSQLVHPHTIRVLDFGMKGSTPFLVMDYAQRGTLRTRYTKGIRLPLATVISYLSDAASALQYIHEHEFIHSHLKPENLFLGEQNHILLSDFGIAFLRAPIDSLSTPRYLDTDHYLAPEQIHGSSQPASDQYALAAMAYEWLSGNHPIQQQAASQVHRPLFASPASFWKHNQEIPSDIEQVLLKALMQDPHERFMDIQGFVHAFVTAAQPFLPMKKYVTNILPVPPTRSMLLPNRSQMSFQSIPVAFTPLIGREQEVQAVGQLMQRADIRLLTITGPGGVGKTRLAAHIGACLQEEFAHGVCFVSLASVSDPGLFLSTIAHVLEQGQVDDLSSYKHLVTFLRDKQILLLLDNFEQLLSAAPMLIDLLADCPQLKILVTSRAVLRVQSEYVFSVPSLTLPNLQHLPESQSLSQIAAVELFISRAQALQPDFELTESNAHAIAEVCVRLDGLPLAIELAAARIKLLPPQALLKRLTQRLTVLTLGTKDAPLRHQTLRHMIKWSVDLLTDEEQRTFRRLAVFVDGWTLEAAETVCAEADDLRAPIMDLLGSLLDKSLVYRCETEEDELRFSMLETLREYALGELTQVGEREHMQQVHALYYLAFAEQAEPELYCSQQKRWLNCLEKDTGNLHTALTWFQTHHQFGQLLRFANALSWFWYLRGHLHEGYRWIEYIIENYDPEVSIVASSKLLAAAGVFAGFLGQRELALAHCQKALTSCLRHGNLRQYTQASWVLVHLLLAENNVASAQAQAKQAFTLAQTTGDHWMKANALSQMGSVALHQSDFMKAQTLLEQSIALYEEEGDMLIRKWPIVRLAEIAVAQHNEKKAHQLLAEALVVFRDTRDTLPQGLYLFGQLALKRGDVSCARLLIEEGAKIHQRIGDRSGMSQASTLLEQITGLEQDESMANTLTRRRFNLSPLSEREREVLGFLARGASNAEIAQILVITIDTVKHHVSNILAKLGASNRTHAVVLARELGLISDDDSRHSFDQGHI